jgi:hypothetical protein
MKKVKQKMIEFHLLLKNKLKLESQHFLLQDKS